MLRSGFVDRIRTIIELKSNFEVEEFNISSQHITQHIEYNDFCLEAEDSLSISYTLSNEKDFSFTAFFIEHKYEFVGGNGKKKKKIDSQTKEIFCHVKPGEIQEIEEFIVDHPQDLLKSIGSWLENLYEEIISISNEKKIARKKEKIDYFVEKNDKLPEKVGFDLQQKEYVKIKLEQLKRQFEDNLRLTTTTTQEEKETEEKIRKLSEDLELLKSQLEYLPQKKWGKSLAIRIFRWEKELGNQKVVQSAGKTIKKLLDP